MNTFKRIATLLLLSFLAGCGGGGDPGTPLFQPGAGTSPFAPGGSGTSAPTLVTVTAPSAQLDSGGDPLTISALVKGTGAILAGVPVTFSTSAGTQLTSVAAVTDISGIATAVLTVSTDKSDRDVKVSVLAGTVTGSVTVTVTGTTLVYTGPSMVSFGSTTNVTAKLTDSKGVAISGVVIGISNTNTVANHLAASSATTDAQGNISVGFTAGALGSDSLLFAGAGTTATATIGIN